MRLKISLILLCLFELYLIIDLALSEHLQDTISCVIFETNAKSAFCIDFFKANSFVLSSTMIYRSIFLPAFIMIGAFAFSVFYYMREDYSQALKINFLLSLIAFILFSLIVIGF